MDFADDFYRSVSIAFANPPTVLRVIFSVRISWTIFLVKSTRNFDKAKLSMILARLSLEKKLSASLAMILATLISRALILALLLYS